MEKFKDYYKVLGVDRNASDEEIKAAYREAAKKYHPDRHPGEEQKQFSELFKQVQEAYDHLGGRKADKKVKSEYDAKWDAHYAARTSFSRNAYGANGPGFDKQEFSRHTTGTYQGRYTNQAEYEEEEKDTAWDKVKQAWQEVRSEEKKDPFTTRHARVDKTILNRDKKARRATTYFDDEYGNRCKGTYIRERKVPAEMLFQFKRGSLHVLYEMLVQLEKIGHVTEDTVPKFVIRNRKTLAGVMAACIIFGGAAAHNDTPQQPEAPAYSSSSSVSEEDMAYGEDVIMSEEERLEQEKVNQEYTVYRKYEIEFGDTLSGLADLAGCPMSEIQSKNGITNSSMIQAGDEILLPYHIESGDLRYATYSAYYAPGSSLTDFADKYSTTVESIVNLNAEAIEDGQVVSDSLLVPNFASQKEITEQKEIANAKIYSKNQ